MPSIDPDQRSGGNDDVQGDVREAERTRQAGDALGQLLDGALAVDPEGSLERDDVAGVLLRKGKARVPQAAYDLVEPVEGEERCDFDSAAMWAGEVRHVHKCTTLVGAGQYG
jgi:hypothetical protein